MSGKVNLFSCTSPCGNCPYRVDAPLQLWDAAEFSRLLETEDEQIGVTYLCHKKNGSACIGWLMDQERRGLPSIMLRVDLSRQFAQGNITGDYLDRLTSPAPLYESVTDMIEANYPELLEGK